MTRSDDFSFVSAMCADENSVYVGTRGAGIVVFPLRDGTPRRIGIEEGLPANSVHSIAILDGKIYAGVTDGYLISYDLKQNRCDVIASSRRKQKLSPFDDQKPFRVPLLVADPIRKRVVFVIGDNVWQLTPADGRITPVLDLVALDEGKPITPLNEAHIHRASPVRGDRVLISSGSRVMELDLARDQAKPIQSAEMGTFQTIPLFVIADGFLWSGDSFSRLSDSFS